jgi:hypothetical protein
MTEQRIFNGEKVDNIKFSRLIDEGIIYGLVGIILLKGEQFLCVIKKESEAASLKLPNQNV